MTHLQQLQKKRTKIVVGLMSGTSVDGIDAAVVRITGSGTKTRVQSLAFKTFSYPPGYSDRVLENSLPGRGSVDVICELNILAAHLFASVVVKIAKKAGLGMKHIDLIGSHGQTIHHIPERQSVFGKQIRSTLQIGDPSTIAKLTGITTVGDFRTADMAVGGQGAPLVPFLDYIMFRSNKENRILLNLGGIANITALQRNCTIDHVTAFDTGPGNMVIDTLTKTFFGKPFDKDGRIARDGVADPNLLEWMLRHDYFKKKPPKSTGREVFGEVFVREFLSQAKEQKPEDLIATATEFTAQSIHRQYTRFVRPGMKATQIVCSGGGAHNKALVRRLKTLFAPAHVVASETLGISSDAKEAILFAVLANETINEHPSNIPRSTGAARPVILGKICL